MMTGATIAAPVCVSPVAPGTPSTAILRLASPAQSRPRVTPSQRTQAFRSLAATARLIKTRFCHVNYLVEQLRCSYSDGGP